MNVRQAILVGALILCVAAAGPAAAEDGKACPLGTQTQNVGGVICVPRTPRTWLVCSGVTDVRGVGLWKDTGVPCDEPPPRSSAQYRPAMEVPHPPPPLPGSKRVIDQFQGVSFRCIPSFQVRWTEEACRQITKEWVAQAEGGKVRYAVLDYADSAEAAQQKGEAAGMPPGSELQWVMTFKPRENGGMSIEPALTGTVEVVHGIYTRRPMIFGGDVSMDAREARTSNAVEAAKSVCRGWFGFLLATN